MNLQELKNEFKKHNINYVKTNENKFNEFDNEHFLSTNCLNFLFSLVQNMKHLLTENYYIKKIIPDLNE